ncbi:unnamed protein product [Larinioides sclopetarius]|uniref:Uncharacterized protein n=1 Tax=Larinioides sclopetarius TaxID=280406 RepID=A0AAV2AA60_9ARAC
MPSRWYSNGSRASWTYVPASTVAPTSAATRPSMKPSMTVNRRWESSSFFVKL